MRDRVSRHSDPSVSFSPEGLACHLVDDDALQERRRDGGDHERDEAEDDRPADRSGLEGSLVGGRRVVDPAEQDGHAADDEQRDDRLRHALDEEGRADGDLRVATEHLERRTDECSEAERTKRDQPGLRWGSPAGLLAVPVRARSRLAVAGLAVGYGGGGGGGGTLPGAYSP